MLIDTHCHLNMNAFNADRDGIVRRAEDMGVNIIIDIGNDLESSCLAVKNSKDYQNVFATVGIHPHDAAKTDENELSEIENLLNHPKVVALGEIGLDYHYDFSPRKIQEKIFRRQLDMARKTNIPVVIHVREAMEDVFRILKDFGNRQWRGVFHCFGGGIDDVHRVIIYGFHISFTGVVTFKNFNKKEVVKAVPFDKLLLETDAPYMAPVPHRGKRNEPSFLIHVAKAVAEMYQVDVEHLSRQEEQNSRMLFGLEC